MDGLPFYKVAYRRMLAANKHYKLVIVENDPDDREIILAILTNEDCYDHVLLLESGKALFHYLDNLASDYYFPRLIALNSQKPLLWGDETLDILKANRRYKQIPVVIYTSVLHPEVEQFLMIAGALEVQEKPMAFTDLQQLILRYCKMSGM
jgi:CheY-like chemotaxis protein